LYTAASSTALANFATFRKYPCLRFASRSRSFQELRSHGRRCSSGLNPDFAQDSLYVLGDGTLAHFENRGDFTVSLALANPKENFRLSFGETERPQRLGIQFFATFS
jgi:hypothetical protein